MHGHLVRVTAPRVIDNFASYRPCRRRRQIEKEKTEKEKTEDRARPFTWTVDMDPRDPRAQPDWEVMWGRRVERAITMQCASMAEGAG